MVCGMARQTQCLISCVEATRTSLLAIVKNATSTRRRMGNTATVIPEQSEATEVPKEKTGSTPDQDPVPQVERVQGRVAAATKGRQDVDINSSSTERGSLVEELQMDPRGHGKIQCEIDPENKLSSGSVETREVVMDGNEGTVEQPNSRAGVVATTIASSSGSTCGKDLAKTERFIDEKVDIFIADGSESDAKKSVAPRTTSDSGGKKHFRLRKSSECGQATIPTGSSTPGTTPMESIVTASSYAKRHRHRRRHRHQHRGEAFKTSHRQGGGNTTDNASDLDQKSKLKLLLEFMPYFGTGDTSRDNMVRSIFSTAEPEELAGDCDEYENTLLILACQYRCKGLVPIILAAGGEAANVDAVNSAGACALHFACYKDSLCMESAVLLLECGAKPEVVENTYG